MSRPLTFPTVFVALSWTLLALSLGCWGCSAPSTVAAAPGLSAATLAIVNETDYDWSIRLTSASGIRSVSKVPRRGRAAVSLIPGTYDIVQETTGGLPPGETLLRTISATFEGGVVYEWPLRTLMASERNLRP